MGQVDLDVLNEFVAEALELLDDAENRLIQLDKGEPLKHHYDAIFRSLHSVKGGCGMLSIDKCYSYTHQVENEFTTYKSQQNLDSKQISILLKKIDNIRKLLLNQDISEDPTQNVIANEIIVTKTESTELPISQNNTTKDIKTSYIDSSWTESEITDQLYRYCNKYDIIFIIDDELDILETVKEILDSETVLCVAFLSPVMAVNIVKIFKPYSIITDRNMPECDGLQVLKQVKQIDVDIPVTFLSGKIDKNLLLDAIQLGVHACLEKPFKIEALTSLAINSINQRKSSLLLNQSLNVIRFLFGELEPLLDASDKAKTKEIIKKEISKITELRRKLRSIKTKQ